MVRALVLYWETLGSISSKRTGKFLSYAFLLRLACRKTLHDVLIHFENILVPLKPVANPTSIYPCQALQLHADGVYTAKPEIHMRLK